FIVASLLEDGKGIGYARKKGMEFMWILKASWFIMVDDNIASFKARIKHNQKILTWDKTFRMVLKRAREAYKNCDEKVAMIGIKKSRGNLPDFNGGSHFDRNYASSAMLINARLLKKNKLNFDETHVVAEDI